MGIEVGGILGLVLRVRAGVKVVQSGVSTRAKAPWIPLILVPPVLWLLLWWRLGPNG